MATNFTHVEPCIKYGEHQPVNTLKQEPEVQRRQQELMEKDPRKTGYLNNRIPTYPRPELRVSHVSHSTDLEGLRGIKADGGFKNSNVDQNVDKMIWFSLTVTPEELRDAETREMILVHPGGQEEPFTPRRSQDQAEDLAGALSEGGILQKFASSPAFMSSSRYGSFRFTFSLRDVLEQYKQQFCGGQEPVLRVYRTVFYTQEVMYAVLVHSPEHNSKFSHLPLLEETPHCICAFRAEPEPHFVWRPQAMSNTHWFELNVIDGELYAGKRERPVYYVWDHVALALHVDDQVLNFEDSELRENLRFCEKRKPSAKPFIEYQGFKYAQAEVNKLWSDQKPLQEFNQPQSQFHVTE